MGHNLSWTMGRQLASFDGITYTYNENGIRTSKTVNNVTTTYYLDGTNIIEQITGNAVFHFYYDSGNELIGFNYADNDYIYVKNQQGDVTDITNSGGQVVASYTYDPWGKITSISGSNLEIANLNPFRYRSYYYDTETGFYYLQSRYYDPEVCRFINCDDVNYIGLTESEASYNPFAYCENEPVNSNDPVGYWGADIHYGKRYNKNEYANNRGKYICYDGTYEWAQELGWNSVYSDKLAYACKYTDTKRGVVFPWCWKYHFNTNKTGIDSREQIYVARLNEAVQKFKTAKNDKQRYAAIKILGEGLHALQDYYAHGSFLPSFKKVIHDSKYDNPYYNWKNNNRNSFGPLLSSLGDRYDKTHSATLFYLLFFMAGIGDRNILILM